MISRAARLATLLFVVCVPQASADYDAGRQAWDAGKPVEALAQWQAAADAGDRRAMLALGRIYLKGLGAPQDYVLAHMWFNLAASRGENEALKERDSLAENLTPSERAEAQKRAREWRPVRRKTDEPKAASAAPGAMAPSRAPVALPPVRAIREAQEFLTVLGYNPGSVDGKWGDRTREAYSAFLRDAGLPRGDVLTPKGLDAMRGIAKRQRAKMAKSPRDRPAPRQQIVKTVTADALRQAVIAGDLGGMEAALKAGVDVNARDRQGWTALMHAANKGYTPMVVALLGAKADVNARTGDGATALFIAALRGKSKIVELLMKGGAEIRIKGPKGKTAVDAARARYGDVERAKKEKEGSGVIALLQGKTLAEVEEARRRRKAEAEERERRRQAELEEQERKRKELEPNWPPGKPFRDCDDCPEMVVIPTGTFVMGSPDHETAKDNNEGPRHALKLTRRFAVGKYEVTRDEYGMFVNETGHDTPGGCSVWDGEDWTKDGHRSWRDPGYSQTGRDPAVCINWHDAKTYVDWLSRKTGKDYRLLSESEWEYVARAGTGTQRYWGDLSEGAICHKANGAGSETSLKWRNETCSDGHTRTSPVGTFGPNGWGPYDMIGNAWEWVEDCWHNDYMGAPSDGSAWTSGGNCGKRVLRGGSWINSSEDLRSANRLRFSPRNRLSSFGFRIARMLSS